MKSIIMILRVMVIIIVINNSNSKNHIIGITVKIVLCFKFSNDSDSFVLKSSVSSNCI